MEDKRLAAAEDLGFIRDVLARTQARIDPHAFHFVMWGALVLVCYPLLNWLELQGDSRGMLWLGVSALALGTILSCAFEVRLAGRPRIPGENTFVSGQVVRIVAWNIAIGALLTAVGPATGIVHHRAVPVVWGFVYANMAFMVGVVYMPEYAIAGLAIAAATLVAWWTPPYRGFILGPFMGLGMIIPGIMAERRVARMRK